MQTKFATIPGRSWSALRRKAFTSVSAVIRERQLANVKRRLRSTNDPIDRIAGQCGFSNANYLKTLFKKRFGMSMRDWRKK